MASRAMIRRGTIAGLALALGLHAGGAVAETGAAKTAAPAKVEKESAKPVAAPVKTETPAAPVAPSPPAAPVTPASAVTKSADKTLAKSGDKSADKSGATPAGDPSKDAPPARTGKSDSKGSSENDAPEASKTKAKPASKAHKAGHAATGAEPGVGEGGSPASPPPLTMTGLRDEVRRQSGQGTIDPGAPPRTKLEQMLAEVTKAREALQQDTTRLEAMLSQDGAEAGTPAGASAPAGGAANASGKPAAKNPLDVLAKALRGIKPEQAAPIVARLDRRLAATVLLRMPPVDAGKILGALKPDTAAELATHLTLRAPSNEGRR